MRWRQRRTASKRESAVRCPGCDRPVDSLRGVPARSPHIVAVYPCGCWLVPDDAARALARRLREEREAASYD